MEVVFAIFAITGDGGPCGGDGAGTSCGCDFDFTGEGTLRAEGGLAEANYIRRNTGPGKDIEIKNNGVGRRGAE